MSGPSIPAGRDQAVPAWPHPSQTGMELPMLAVFLSRLRTRAGLSQTQLAALLGVNQTAISQWEHAIAEPRGGHLFTLLVKLAPASLTMLAEHTGQHHRSSQPP